MNRRYDKRELTLEERVTVVNVVNLIIVEGWNTKRTNIIEQFGVDYIRERFPQLSIGQLVAIEELADSIKGIEKR